MAEAVVIHQTGKTACKARFAHEGRCCANPKVKLSDAFGAEPPAKPNKANRFQNRLVDLLIRITATRTALTIAPCCAPLG